MTETKINLVVFANLRGLCPKLFTLSFKRTTADHQSLGVLLELLRKSTVLSTLVLWETAVIEGEKIYRLLYRKPLSQVLTSLELIFISLRDEQSAPNSKAYYPKPR